MSDQQRFPRLREQLEETQITSTDKDIATDLQYLMSTLPKRGGELRALSSAFREWGRAGDVSGSEFTGFVLTLSALVKFVETEY